MTRFMKHGLMAVCLLAQAVPAAADVDVDHDGDGRKIIVNSHGSDSSILSRGDGGVLDVVIDGSHDIRLHHLGGDSEAYVDVYDSADTDVFVGHCPEGMNPEAFVIEGADGGLFIPRCH